MPISDQKLAKLKNETQNDSSLQDLKHVVEIGWPKSKQEAPVTTMPYWNCRDEISTANGIVFKGERVIVPKGMQADMLSLIHSSHLGAEKCKRRAKEVLYWPGMNAQIEDVVLNCQTCCMYQRRNMKEPLLCHEVPSRPWAKVGVDIFELQGNSYLVLVDYYSGFIEVNQLRNIKSHEIITYCKSQFARHGIPDILITDNGPQFSSDKFKIFANAYQFNHRTSSPHYPQSNGRAEKAVQTAKSLIKKAMHDGKDPHLALLEYLNTPTSDALGSPAQRLMGRRTKSIIPITEEFLKPQIIDPQTVQHELKQNKLKQKFYYDVHTKCLSKLQVGDNVLMQRTGKWRPSKVICVRQETPLSYDIMTPNGQTYRRNRHHLKKVRKEIDQEQYLDDDEFPNEANAAIVNNSELQRPEATEEQTTMVPVALRRSQRQRKEPVRYRDWNT